MPTDAPEPSEERHPPAGGRCGNPARCSLNGLIDRRGYFLLGLTIDRPLFEKLFAFIVFFENHPDSFHRRRRKMALRLLDGFVLLCPSKAFLQMPTPAFGDM